MSLDGCNNIGNLQQRISETPVDRNYLSIFDIGSEGFHFEWLDKNLIQICSECLIELLSETWIF